MSNLNPVRPHLTWAEINKNALSHNIKTFRRIIGPSVILAPCVKANAYGHSIIDASQIMLRAGADWLSVNALFEADILRKAGIKNPIYIMGYVAQKDIHSALELNCRLVVYNKETIENLSAAAKKMRKKARVHLKIETGNNRQGILMDELENFADFIKKYADIEIEGISTHFANIEDTKNGGYARFQLNNFNKAIQTLEKKGIKIPIKHCANSAATILFPKTHFSMVRPGIAVYGLWPSQRVKEIAEKSSRKILLKPVLSWKTVIAQIKTIPKGSYVGYGCTFKTKRKTRLAILPIGYYDGYDRGFSNKSYVLIRGKRAPLLGRVCMNMIMVDATQIPEAQVEDTATLLGKDGKNEITAENLAELIGTINYEITTRINENIPRIVV